MNTVTATESAFFYVDGIPTKGIWIELDSIDGMDEVREQLHAAGLCSEHYDGDILCAVTEGVLAPYFNSRHDIFDFSGFTEARDCDVDAEVIAAWTDHMGSFDLAQIEEAYLGAFESDLDFAYDYIEQTGYLHGVPEHIKGYFDYNAFARDLMMDHFAVNGHYFRSI